MLLQVTSPDKLKKNKYHNAPRKADYTIDQDWESYTPDEHDRWNRLFERQKDIINGRACRKVIDAISTLQLSQSGIPDMAVLSERLNKLTGWSVVPVAGLVPDDVFFDHLANRRFPAGAFIRPEEEFDYLQEPDVFHDIYGHVPMLADPIFADFMQAYGKGGQRALELDQLHNLARLYWYTVEFGLIREDDELRIYGAGILSSAKETVFSIEDDSPHRIDFNLERIMCTDYIIDDFQKTYFIIDDFQSLLDKCYKNFDKTYSKVKDQPAIQPHETRPSDRLINKGTLSYFQKRSNTPRFVITI